MRCVDLERMLRMCRQGQWEVGDLDFDQTPRAKSVEDERARSSNRSRIWRRSSAWPLQLFVEQQRRVLDPTLKEIYGTFVIDEMRHSHVAQMLADHYDRRRLEVYRPSRSLGQFFPHFIDAIRYHSDDIANAYITSEQASCSTSRSCDRSTTSSTTGYRSRR